MPRSLFWLASVAGLQRLVLANIEGVFIIFQAEAEARPGTPPGAPRRRRPPAGPAPSPHTMADSDQTEGPPREGKEEVASSGRVLRARAGGERPAAVRGRLSAASTRTTTPTRRRAALHATPALRPLGRGRACIFLPHPPASSNPTNTATAPKRGGGRPPRLISSSCRLKTETPTATATSWTQRPRGTGRGFFFSLA